MGMKTREEDFVSQLIIDSTHAFLLCFTNTGRVYWVKVYEVPDVGAAGKGKSMHSCSSCSRAKMCALFLPVRDLEEEGKYLLRHAQGDGEEDAAEGLFECDGAGNYRYRY